MFSRNKNILTLAILLFWNLSACTGAGPVSSPLTQGIENTATSSSESNHPSTSQEDDSSPSEDSSSEADISPISIAKFNPPAQPTQPVIIDVHLLEIHGTVVLPGGTPDPECGKNDKHPAPFATSIPTVKSWIKAEDASWELKFILGKKETEEDEILPFAVDHCGGFTGRLYIMIGPNPNECGGNEKVKFTASYKDDAGMIYTGDSHIYTCNDAPNFPDAFIELKPLALMMNPNYMEILTNP